MKKLIFSALGFLLFCTVASADTLGHIEVCYNCSSDLTHPTVTNFGFGVQDAPIFQFDNTSGNAITNALFTILVSGDNATQDTFKIGTISANSFFDIFVGVTNDGGAGHTFFAPIGPNGRDTSDIGPNSDAIQFSFSGLNGSDAVSASLTVGASAGPSLDATVNHLNFLGGPANADGPCNNCFYSGNVADLTTSTPGQVPEPGTLGLLASGFIGIGCELRRRVWSK